MASRWNPRRSLGARLLFLLLPVTILPVSVYWALADRESSSSEKEVRDVLVAHATERERARLVAAAEVRVHELEAQAGRLRQVLAAATAETARALEAPSRPGPRPELEELPGGFLATAPEGASVALLSAAASRRPEALRDVSATRVLETPFLALLAGQSGIVSLYVTTASGILRAVPAGDVRRYVRETGLSGDPRSPTRNAAPLAAPGTPPDAVAWTRPYPDVYRGQGLLVTAVRLVRDDQGRLLGEVGVDWAVERSLGGGDAPESHGIVELLLPGADEPPIVRPAGRLAPDEVAAVEQLAARERDGEHELSSRGETRLVVLRGVAGLPWRYARRTSLTAARAEAEAQTRAVFAADRRARIRLRLLYVAVMAGLAAAVVLAVGRALAPIRSVARFADAISAGETPRDLASLPRLDEVGRLVTAMTKLERRVRRRISTMEGTHQLAQTASVMTSPEGTYARLTRLVAEGVGAAKCWLALWEPETRSLVLTPPGHGVPDGSLRGRRLAPADSSLLTACYRTGEILLVNDVAAQPRHTLVPIEELGVMRNVALLPLRTEAGVLGVLAVADKPEGFDGDDRAALEVSADQAALLLRNARLYEELQKSYERLRDAQRNRDYFLQNVNHELRTPLTAILGWSEILSEDRPDPETMRTATDQIRRSAQFLLTLISDLLDLSRFQDGRTRLEPVETDLAVLVAESVEPLAVMAEGKGIALVIAAPPAGTVRARLDPMRMRQVLWNLVHNAVKFTPRGGRIEVSAAPVPGGVSFAVSDDGPGIDPKDLPHIFERFRQADGSTTRAYRGMGIGLALVKAFVELHGGTVTAESRPGRGTTFRVHIPKPAAEEKNA